MSSVREKLLFYRKSTVNPFPKILFGIGRSTAGNENANLGTCQNEEVSGLYWQAQLLERGQVVKEHNNDSRTILAMTSIWQLTHVKLLSIIMSNKRGGWRLTGTSNNSNNPDF